MFAIADFVHLVKDPVWNCKGQTMDEQPEHDPVAVIYASGVRRGVGMAVLVVLTVLLFWTAFASPPNAGWGREALAVFGIVMIAVTLWFHRKSTIAVIVTEDGMSDSNGRHLCDFDDVLRVERGAFAAKPSNGFVLKLKTRHAGAWAPGIYWQFGKRLGVGGVTPAGQTKFVAEYIAEVLNKKAA